MSFCCLQEKLDVLQSTLEDELGLQDARARKSTATPNFCIVGLSSVAGSGRSSSKDSVFTRWQRRVGKALPGETVSLKLRQRLGLGGMRRMCSGLNLENLLQHLGKSSLGTFLFLT
ncbi:hypothetical protein SLEP1_g3202 [Rubroshorea leprosula]|uniref:Uncharacterized protein n=1 Tax=Rubroshorea leprosula TaxID=152421 RepID=A0AAV5HJK3_9ROSI|nr:hypothetical protein SLEP1_g3202 [Rubroshorea leprosula]